MNGVVEKIRKWLGLDKEPPATHVGDEELARAEGEGMTSPEVETPIPPD